MQGLNVTLEWGRLGRRDTWRAAPAGLLRAWWRSPIPAVDPTPSLIALPAPAAAPQPVVTSAGAAVWPGAEAAEVESVALATGSAACAGGPDLRATGGGGADASASAAAGCAAASGPEGSLAEEAAVASAPTAGGGCAEADASMQGMAWLAEKAAAAPDLDSSAGASGCGADSKRRLDGAGQRWTRDLPAGAVAASGVPPRTRADWAGSGGGAGSSGSATDAHDTRANANSESWGTLPEARARNAAGIVGQAHAVRALGAPAPGAPRLPPESAGSALQRASSNRSGGGAGGAGVRAAVIPGMRRVVEVAAAHQGPAAGVEAAPITVSEIVSEWLFSGHEVVTVRMGGARAHALAEVRRGLH